MSAGNSCAVNWIIWFGSSYVRHQNLQTNKLLIAFRNHNATVLPLHAFTHGMVMNESVFGFIVPVLRYDTRELVYTISNWRNVVDVIARFNSLENGFISTFSPTFFDGDARRLDNVHTLVYWWEIRICFFFLLLNHPHGLTERNVCIFLRRSVKLVSFFNFIVINLMACIWNSSKCFAMMKIPQILRIVMFHVQCNWITDNGTPLRRIMKWNTQTRVSFNRISIVHLLALRRE